MRVGSLAQRQCRRCCALAVHRHSWTAYRTAVGTDCHWRAVHIPRAHCHQAPALLLPSDGPGLPLCQHLGPAASPGGQADERLGSSAHEHRIHCFLPSRNSQHSTARCSHPCTALLRCICCKRASWQLSRCMATALRTLRKALPIHKSPGSSRPRSIHGLGRDRGGLQTQRQGRK